MNYEDLFTAAKAIDKEITDRMKSEQRLTKSVQKSMEAGDLKSWLRDLALLMQSGDEHRDALSRMWGLAEGFDAKAYIENGDFAMQLLEACGEANLDVKGEFPVYEIFPYRVRVDAENQDLYVDRKKVQSLRPQSFARDLKASREKLLKASFNAAAFAAELAVAYDTALICQSAGKAYAKEADCYLTSLYQYLAPMSRLRREYDKQSYAFDLARLYGSGIEEIKGGRRFQFGPSRNNQKAIRILDSDGVEQFLATIRFYK
jgi:hypothetical protein